MSTWLHLIEDVKGVWWRVGIISLQGVESLFVVKTKIQAAGNEKNYVIHTVAMTQKNLLLVLLCEHVNIRHPTQVHDPPHDRGFTQGGHCLALFQKGRRCYCI